MEEASGEVVTGRDGGVGARFVYLCALLLALAALAAWANSFSGAFQFDDHPSIIDNPGIKDLGNLGSLIKPPPKTSQEGRPLPNITLALNYALGGLDVWGYHAVNLALHVAAALALFGLLRRTLLHGRGLSHLSPHATWLAFSAALLWTLHPLQTAAVTYIIQRIEVMASLFYLLTLYCFARYAADEEGGKIFAPLAVAACLCGMASKEITASLPVVVFLYDRCFFAGTFREAWRRRSGLHLALAACWLLLALLMYQSGTRSGTAGMVQGFPPLEYAKVELAAITRYLSLAFWPSPLVFDYGRPNVQGFWNVALPGALVASLLAATLWALVKLPQAGFCGALFFCVLAPTSSFIPIRDPIFEHRMYLPLAAVISLLVCFAAHLLSARRDSSSTGPWPVYVAALLLAPALATATVVRNAQYRTEYGLWMDTLQKRPGSGRAHQCVGAFLFDEGRFAEAGEYFQRAWNLDRSDAAPLVGLGMAQLRQGDYPAAIRSLETAARFFPKDGRTNYQLARAYFLSGNDAMGLKHIKEVVESSELNTTSAHEMARQLQDEGYALEAADFAETVLARARAAGDAERVAVFEFIVGEARAGRPIPPVPPK